MRDPDRIKSMLKHIETIWSKHPDLRLGQLLLNSCDSVQLYYIEDSDLMNKLISLYNENN